MYAKFLREILSKREKLMSMRLALGKGYNVVVIKKASY